MDNWQHVTMHRGQLAVCYKVQRRNGVVNGATTTVYCNAPWMSITNTSTQSADRTVSSFVDSSAQHRGILVL